jgi:hypothetical protein
MSDRCRLCGCVGLIAPVGDVGAYVEWLDETEEERRRERNEKVRRLVKDYEARAFDSEGRCQHLPKPLVRDLKLKPDDATELGILEWTPCVIPLFPTEPDHAVTWFCVRCQTVIGSGKPNPKWGDERLLWRRSCLTGCGS